MSALAYDISSMVASGYFHCHVIFAFTYYGVLALANPEGSYHVSASLRYCVKTNIPTYCTPETPVIGESR